MSAPDEREPGRIFTFYSYKGGTGRSMALANVAWILASNGKRVLTIDWDLEAPGLHRYFAPFLSDAELRYTHGIIDFMVDYDLHLAELAMAHEEGPDGTGAEPAGPGLAGVAEPAGSAAGGGATAAAGEGAAAGGAADEPQRGGVVAYEEEEEPWRELVRRQARNIHLYATPLRGPLPRDGEIDFIPAGMQGPHYATRVNSYDWKGLYESRHGWELVEAVKEELRREYDYVLIDSRTGVSDTSGICSVQFPDAVVACFTLNNQGIHGASNVAADIAAKRVSPPVEIFPVPMRVEMNEKEKADARKSLARERFAQFPALALGDVSRDRYWGDVSFPYVPFYAYEEVLAAFGDRRDDTTSVLASAERLTGFLTEGKVRELVPCSEPERVRILKLFTGREEQASAGPLTPEQRAAKAEREFAGLAPPEQEAAFRVFARLVQPVRGAADGWGRVPMSAFEADERTVIARLTPGVLTQQRDESSGADVVQIADPGLALAWARLGMWLDRERDFLLWRRRLAASLADWEDNERDTSSLLTGARLSAAMRWRDRQGERLTPAEAEFIHKSVVRSGSVVLRWVLFVIVTLGLTGYAAFTVSRSVRQQREAEQRQRELEAQLRDSLTASRVRTLVSRGGSLHAQGEYIGAVAAYDTVLAIQPRNPQALYGRGLTRYDRGELQLAISDFNRAIAADSLNASSYYWRGAAYEQSGDTSSSVADLRRAVSVARDPELVSNAQTRLGRLLAATGGVVVDTTVRIYVHYRGRADVAAARQVAQTLGVSGYKVLGVERRPDETANPNIRYFHPVDSTQARLVQRGVSRALRGPPITTRYLSDRRYARVPPGQIEVWIPELPNTSADTTRKM